MKKLALNVIVLGVIGTAFGLTSCNLFGSKETKTETEVKMTQLQQSKIQ